MQVNSFYGAHEINLNSSLNYFVLVFKTKIQCKKLSTHCGIVFPFILFWNDYNV